MGRTIDAKVILAYAVVCLMCINVVAGQDYFAKSKTNRGRPKSYVQSPPVRATSRDTQGLSSPSGKLPDTIVGCYTGDHYWPSVRLPNSLDNLIFIVEKIEKDLAEQNVSIHASFVANLILRRFQRNGIVDVAYAEAKTVDKNEETKQDIIFRLFPVNNLTFPENILNDKEKCALHWMLSTSINTTKLMNEYDSNYDPNAIEYPRENGAIYAGIFGTLSGGPLLSGIAASANLNIVKVQDMTPEEKWPSIDGAILSSEVDPVLISSLAGEIGQSAYLYAYPMYSHPVFGPEGAWNGTVCPTTLSSVETYTTYASKAELLGATDGMIIGGFLRSAYYRQGKQFIPTLSQVLRSYYGRGLQLNNYHACDRSSQAAQLMGGASVSAIGFAVVYDARGIWMTGHQFPDDATLSQYMSQAIGNFTQTYLNSQQFSCGQEQIPRQCQTLNDIIVVMDTSVQASYDNFQEQKNFIGLLIQKIGVYPNGSHVGVVTFGSNKEPIPLNPEQSGAEIRCQLQWNNIYSSSSDVSQTIRFVMDRFKSLRNSQKNRNYPQAPGKVVIFIYMASSLSNTEDVKKTMNELRWEIPEVTTLAVGKNRDTLRNFVVDDKQDIFNQAGEQLSINVDNVVKRLCTAPTTIEYNCLVPRPESESELIATDFVYQDSYQWIGISPWTMNRSENLYLNFESQYGSARFCIDRKISYDPSGMSQCFETSPQSPNYRYGPVDPCSSYEYNCPWFYINVRGRTGGNAETCNEQACDSPNQIKVTITHEGLKCAGYQTTALQSTVFISILVIMTGLFDW